MKEKKVESVPDNDNCATLSDINKLDSDNDSDTIKSGTETDTAAVRMGERIRRIRTALGMSQAELGDRIGLSADRVQKYENGFRKPKADMLNKIANALGVEIMALTDPILTSPEGVMYALFEMERAYNADIRRTGTGFNLTLSGTKLDSNIDTTTAGNSETDTIDSYLLEWTFAREHTEEAIRSATSAEEKKKLALEYDIWKWTFPKSVTGNIDKEKRKKLLKEKIEILQLELSRLEDKD